MKKATVLFTVIILMCTLLCSCKDDERLDIAQMVYDFSENALKTETVKLDNIEDVFLAKGSIGYFNVRTVNFNGSGGVVTSVSCKAGDKLKSGDTIAVITDAELNGRYENAKNNTELARLAIESKRQSGANSFEINDAEADYEIEKIKLNKIEKELEDYTVKAPFDCVVQNLLEVQVGDSVRSDQPICVVADTSSLCVYYGGDGTDNFRFGQGVTISCKDNSAVGRVVSAPCDAPKKSGESSADYVVFSINADLIKWVDVTKQAADINAIRDKSLTSPTSIAIADIKLVKDYRENVPTVPASAVSYKGDRAFVNVLKNGNKIQTFVETGLATASKAEIISGVNEGDVVILGTTKSATPTGE